MVTKKDLVIAILATFCLTVTIFMIMPIKSANNAYDPMLDYNHDGNISLADLAALANSYGTTGDPTVNVTVKNLPCSSYISTCSVSWANYNSTGGHTPNILGPYVAGYSRMYVYGYATNATFGYYNVTIYLHLIAWFDYDVWSERRWEWVDASKFSVPVIVNGSSIQTDFQYITENGSITVKAPQFALYFDASSPTVPYGTVDLSLSIYLRNE